MQQQGRPFYRIEGVIKHYDWGGKDFLSRLLSRPNEQEKPMAEYWLGAHHLSSSTLFTDQGNILLKDFIRGHEDKILGRSAARKFGCLPYLLKILDVKDPLSIQVHPSKYEAESGFASENKEGIALTATNRNYKDNNHKPELMVALSDFWLLHGFKPSEELIRILGAVPEFSGLEEIFISTGYDQLYKTVMEMPQQTVNEILKPLLDRIIPLYQENKLDKNQEDFWAARAALNFNVRDRIDRGIFSIYFFNLVHLQKGEAVFQDSGLPHSYLEGKNVEIMANSDNVLRGGLTNKHIDVKELMKHVKFEETIPSVIQPKISGDELVYVAAAPDFKLSQYKLAAAKEIVVHAFTGEILIVISGKISLSAGDHEMQLSRGEAAFLVADASVNLRVLEPSEIFKASIPHSGE